MNKSNCIFPAKALLLEGLGPDLVLLCHLGDGEAPALPSPLQAADHQPLGEAVRGQVLLQAHG